MIFRFFKRRRAQIKAKEEALKLLDENLSKIITNLVRIAVIERNQETRFEVWEREIVEWLNEIYRKCENLKYGGKITYSEYDDALKNALSNPKVVFDTALMDFSDDDFYKCDEDKEYSWRGRENICHDYKLQNIIFVIRQQFWAMEELRWDKKTFTREFMYVKYIKLGMP